MKGVPEGDHLVLAAVLRAPQAGQLDQALVGLRAAVAEQDLALHGNAGEPPGQPGLGLGVIKTQSCGYLLVLELFLTIKMIVIKIGIYLAVLHHVGYR